MKKFFLPFFLLQLFSFSGSTQNVLSIIPQPQRLERETGSFPLNRARISYGNHPGMKRAALFLSEKIKEQTGLSIEARLVTAGYLPIRFLSDSSIQNKEGYKLDITPGSIEIRSRGEKGFFWAVQTLRQLIPSHAKHSPLYLPCVRIEDWPQYAWRSNMLDVGRHFFPVSYIKQHLDMLSYYKMNIFHWHLTDDQGWRIEIKKYPLLTSIGAWRQEADGSRTGGYYTQEEIKEVVAYARERNISIIPEIEMPGHCRAALAAYPWLSCNKTPLPVPSFYGVMQDVYCAGQEKTYQFIEDVLDEVMRLFPSPVIHIGGDECPKTRWEACPVCLERMKTEHLQNAHELQSYFVKRIEKYLESKGRKLMGWDEILEGGADSSALVEIWRGEEKSKEALANGNSVVQTLYFDAPPASLTLEKTFAYRPEKGEPKNSRVLGADCPLWTEGVTPFNVSYMMFPRLQAFAEALWNGHSDYASFQLRLQAHYRYMKAKGILYGSENKNLLSIRLKFLPSTTQWRFYAQTGTHDMSLRYWLNKSKEVSGLFRDSLTLARPGDVRMIPWRNGKQALSALHYHILSHQAVGHQMKFQTVYSEKYGQGGDYGLTDGITGSWNFSDGTWLGWQGADLDASVDLGKAVRIDSLQLRCLQATQSWIMLPRAVSYFISDDGKNWRLLARVTHKIPDTDYTPQVHAFIYRLPEPRRARYIRVLAQNYGTLPAWHNGAGGAAWLFADEFLVQ